MLANRAAFLKEVSGSVEKPAYDVAKARTGIVHLGVGAFHRAHQAPLIDTCIAAGDDRWAIAGVSLRSDAVQRALTPQGGLYILLVKGDAARKARLVGSLASLHSGPGERAAIVAALSNPDVAIVSLTVSESGYLMDATGDLNDTHPAFSAERDGHGLTIYGLILEALAARRAAGHPPFTLLPCDNLSGNGERLRALTVQAAATRMPSLVRWLEDTLTVRSTMVDRITPATTDADRVAVANMIGTEDRWPIVTEPFWHFVVEEGFALGRPDWEPLGVSMVPDVAPYETMKLRLLNGAHSAIAYAGLLLERETVADAMADADISAFVNRLWQASAQTLPAETKGRAADYTRALTERFSNRALPHRCAQIANDGSLKLPHRIIAPAHALLAKGAPIEPLAAAVALWCEALRQKGEAFSDPNEAVHADANRPPAEAVAALARTLSADAPRPLVDEVTKAVELIRTSGTRAFLQSPQQTSV